LEQILNEIREKENKFRELNLDEYTSIIEETFELRELADYGVAFEAGGNEKQIAQILSKAEELITITEYILDKAMVTENGKAVLHFPREQEDHYLPSDLFEDLSLDGNSIIKSMLVLANDFDATIFAYRLLSERNVYFTKSPPYFFQGGTFAKYKNGHFSYQDRPAKGFIELSKETVKKWSMLVKPKKLGDIGTCRENVTQYLPIFFQDCFLDLLVLPDGRLYLSSSLNEQCFQSQLKAFKAIEQVIKKILEKHWSDYSVLSAPIEILSQKHM